MKYNKLARVAAGLYHSRALSIFKVVVLASETLFSISAAVFLVVSKFSTRAVSPRILSEKIINKIFEMLDFCDQIFSMTIRIGLPPADDSLESRSSSNVFNIILKSFCCFVNSAYESEFVLKRSKNFGE